MELRTGLETSFLSTLEFYHSVRLMVQAPKASKTLVPGKPGEPVVIKETTDWVAWNKPPGWLVVPPSHPDKTPVLTEHMERTHGSAWPVHRLDKDTSGVVLMARNAEAHRKFSMEFMNRQATKIYDVIALGEPQAPTFRCAQPIRGLPSVTQLDVQEQFMGAFLGRVRIVHGRRHQIRIHLSQAGNPVAGDVRYGGPIAAKIGKISIERTALHAARLELTDTGILLAPWPRDFARWVQELHG